MPHSQLCFASPLKYFQARQIMIHWKRFLHLLRVFFYLLKLLEHFKGKQALLQKGKAPSTRQKWKKSGPGPVGGNQPSLPPEIRVFVLLTPTQGKPFHPFLRVCASRSTAPSSDQKYIISEHTLVLNKQPSFRNAPPCAGAHLLRDAFVTCETTAASITGTQNPFGRGVWCRQCSL